jgi:transcriptional regulator with XRE-family HTH domain
MTCDLVNRMTVLRKAAGLSRDEHSRRAGFDLMTMADWERRNVVPNVANLEVALNVLGYGLKITPRAPPLAPLRSGPLVFIVAGILRDNGPRRWQALEIAAVLKDYAPKQIENALGRLRRENRVAFNGTSYKATEETVRSTEACDAS